MGGASGGSPASRTPRPTPAAPARPAGKAAGTDARPAAASGTGTATRATRKAPPAKRRLVDYPRAGKKGIVRWLPSWRLLLGFVATVLAAGFGLLVAMYAATPVPTPDDFVDAQTTTVYYSDGATPMGTFSVQNRVIIDGDQIPRHLRDAVIAAEDRTFETNSGINPVGIARALWNNLTGGKTQGGSSITQQYAERYYIGTTVSDYRGKLEEALLAIKLDQQQDKDEILANYLNTIYFGRDSYGVETAAQSYFGISAKDLTLSQSALIAGVIPSPNNFDPRVSREDAERRWNYVLDGMVTIGKLDQATRDQQVFPETVEYQRSDRFAGPQGYLLDTVRRELTERAGLTEDDLDLRGYNIVTTIDPGLQQMMVDAVATLPEDAPANLRTAAVTLDPRDGAILAMYGGPDFLTVSRNAVTQDEAQAGSTFKPFTLVAYLENGGSLKSLYTGDSPMDFPGFENGVGNFGGQSFGEIDVLKATASSVNTVYVQMNAEVGPDKTLEVAERAGLPEEALVGQEVLANVLGTASPHPIDMAEAYNTFAAQGVHSEPFIVRTVTTLGGEDVYAGAQEPQRVFAEDVMADTTYALTQVVEAGTAGKVQAVGYPVAGKTGTSNENRSAWFVGYTPQLTTAVAMFQVGPEGETEEITPFGGATQITGGTWPAEVWTTYMTGAMAGRERVEFPPRADVGTPNKKPMVAIPAVTGVPEWDARVALEGAGFVVEIARQNDPAIEEGLAITTDPVGEAEEGSTVTIIVSLGVDPEAPVAVPSVVGQAEADARAALEAAGFAVSITRQASDTVAAGVVISQSPASGTALPGITVTVVVSSGPTAPPPPDPTPTPDPTSTEEPTPTESPTESPSP